MRQLGSDERGDRGEKRAQLFLCDLFAEVTTRPSPDHGTDAMCSGPCWMRTLMATTPIVRFQVKSGESYSSKGIPFAASTLNLLLERIEGEPVIVLYYHNSRARYLTPDCFLVLNTWILGHVDQVQLCLAARQELRIPHADFEHLVHRGTTLLKAALNDEFRRATSHRDHLLAPRHDQLPEYSYVRQFTRVVKVWDISLLPAPEMSRLFGVTHASQVKARLVQATESEYALRQLLRAYGRTSKHPINRVPPNEVESAQARYYRALLEHGAGKAFHLPQRFTVSESAAGRAMAAKYPNLVFLVEQVLHNWQRRPVGEVLNATQVAGVLSHYREEDAENRVITALRRVEREIRHIRIPDFQSYRLIHHIYLALAETTGDRTAAGIAIDLASRFLQWELQHLEDYGWHVGPHVVDLYYEAEQNTSLRGQKLRHYNHGMREIMGHILS